MSSACAGDRLRPIRRRATICAGAASPALDALIEAILSAKTREDFVTAVRAYDRVLLSGFYIVPFFHPANQWLAHDSGLKRPERLPRYGAPIFPATLDTWWREK